MRNMQSPDIPSLKGNQPSDIPSFIEKVTKEELMNESHSTSAIIKSLIDKGFLFTYEIEVGRLNTSGESHFESIKPLDAPAGCLQPDSDADDEEECGALAWSDFQR